MGLVIPIFIPHRGCPHQCLFCNQESITGCSEDRPDFIEQVNSLLQEWLQREDSRSGPRRQREVAFYGGSFTCLDESDQYQLLQLVQPYLSEGRIDGIRLSTRPDCITTEIIDFLRDHGVKKIELGVQSLDDVVLKKAKRGHSAEQSARAIALIKAGGVEVGVQMMVGLPGESNRSFLAGLDTLVALMPDFVRLYPVVVVRHSELEELYHAGKYSPLSHAKAIALATRFRVRMDRARIPIIRIGLQPSRELEDMLVAGPYHPAFAELVNSRLWLRDIRDHLSKLREGESLRLSLSPRDLSVCQGIQKYNRRRIDALGYADRFFLCCEPTMARGTRKFEVVGSS